MHSLLAAWRVSLHRTRADWPIVAAAALITLLAATLLAAGPIYSDAVSEAGLHRTLAAAPITAANVEVSARVATPEVASADAAVRGLIGESVGAAGATVVAGAASDAFAVPGQVAGEVRDLVKLGFQEGLAENATLIEGGWPENAANGAPLQVAVLETTAETLALGVGDRLVLASRTDDLTVDVEVVGVYRPTDPAAAFWWGDPVLLDGLVESEEYRTFGPLFTTRDDLAARASGTNLLLTWRAFPNFDALSIGEIGGLRSRMEQLQSRIGQVLPNGFATSSTRLPDLLSEAERSLLASRTGVLLLLAQLAVLAGYAIALTADLIVDHRRLDTALLRSRGASTLQVGLLAVIEAALLAIPAALAAPWLASLALRLFNAQGPLAAIGLAIEPRITSESYLAAAGAAIGCGVLLVLPTFLAARSYAAERSGRSRPGTRTLGQRVGLDIALLALTAVGLWQLRLYGSPLTRTIQGQLGLDPLLVAAPAIGILAGSVVALRVVPMLARVADALASRGRTLVGSLGARQLARRPLRYTRTALLLMLAISMGVFSVSYGTTWEQSQADQADFQVGADARVTPARRLDALPGWAVETAYRSVDGVEAAMPLGRADLRVGSSDAAGEVIAIDAGAVAPVLLRGAAETAGFANLAAGLASARPDAAALALPGRPQRIALSATIRIGAADVLEFNPTTGEATSHPADPGAVAAGTTAAPVVTIRDARGLLHRFTGEAAAIAPSGWQLIVPLTATSAARAATIERLGGEMTMPIELVGVDLILNLPGGSRATEGQIAVDGLAVSDAPDGADWRPLVTASAGAWSAGIGAGGETPQLVGSDPTALAIDVGGANGTIGAIPGVDRFGRGALVTFAPAAIATLGADVLEALVNQPFLAALSARAGDTVVAPLPGGSRRIHVAGVIDAFPTTDPTAPLAVVDLPSLGLLRFAGDHGVELADEWWLDTDGSDGAAAAIEAARTGGALSGATVLAREATRERLSTDPLALATIGALSLGFVVAGLFAVIGLTVSAAVSARQRRTEFALLRALGLSGNQLSGWLLLENGSLVAVSLVAGTGLGLLIGWVVLPFITVTQGGAVPFPPVSVQVPWSSVLVLELISIGALAVTLMAVARSMRRAGVGSVLRMGED